MPEHRQRDTGPGHGVTEVDAHVRTADSLSKDERMSRVARLRASVERRPVVSFYLLAFAITALLWLDWPTEAMVGA